MNKRKFFLIFLITIFLISGTSLFYIYIRRNKQRTSPPTENIQQPIVRENRETGGDQTLSPTLIPTQAPLPTLPTRKVLSGGKQMFQTFNNCGPASLAMTLSYYNINLTQQELGDQMRPYQIPSGDNDDKSVTFAEMAEKAKEYNLSVYQRPAGNIDMIQQIINQGLPVVVKTWLNPNEDIGHFRVVKGYDQSKQVLIQDDSYQGKNIAYSYDEFNNLWQVFNYEFMVLVPQQKQQVVENILGELVDKQQAWQQALAIASQQVENNPNDTYAQFNRLRANYYLGNYQQTVDIYQQIKDDLPRRMLWYQYEPILAYYQLKDYDQVLNMTQQVFDSQNRAFSELHYLRAKIYDQRGNQQMADQEYQLAEKYNSSIYWKANLATLDL
jgi:tetratricopeptide (TPR) repeat protein